MGLRVGYNMTLAEVLTALTRALIYDEDETRQAFRLDQCVPDRDGTHSVRCLPWFLTGEQQANALLKSRR